MKLEQIKAFLAVADTGSFRAAADSLHKTQPTVSASIRGLEELFSTKLFDRESYRPTLTAEGKKLYEEAHRLISAAEDFETLGFSLSKGARASLSLSISAMCTRPPRIERFRYFFASFEDIELLISTEHHTGILERLNSGKAELAIGPNMMLSNQYEYHELEDIHMVTVAVPNYFTTLVGGFVPQKIAREKPHILVADSGTKSPIDPLNTLTGSKKWFVRDYHMKKELVLAGLGWARMPLHYVENEIQDGRLVRVQIEHFNNTGRIPIFIIRLRDRTLSRTAAEFWNYMVD